MGHHSGSSIHRSGSRPQLDLSKAVIQPNSEERDPTILLPNQSDDISSHLALDIGGLFFMFVYIFLWFFGYNSDSAMVIIVWDFFSLLFIYG